MESPLKISVILLTAATTVGIGVGGLKLYASLSESNVLNANSQDEESSSLGVTTRIQKGDAFYVEKDYEAAKEAYEIALDLDPQNAEILLRLAKTQLSLQEYELAAASFQTAYELSPSAETSAEYGHFLTIQKEWLEAEKILNSVEENTQNLLYRKSLYNIVRNQMENAKVQLELAQESSGELSETLLQNYLNSFATFENAQGAENTYLQALLCKSLIDAEEYELAGLMAHGILEKKNDYRDVWMLLGYAEFKLGKYGDAEEAFKQAKRIDSVKPEVHYFLGSILIHQEEYAAAIDELELALLYGFTPAEQAYEKIAEAHEAIGAWQEAVVAYEALLNLNPESSDAFLRPIELCLNELKDPSRALSLAQKATTLFPSQAMAHSLEAEVYWSQGQLESAGNSINTAFGIDPNFPRAHYIAGLLREAQNNKEGALWEFKKVFELTEETDVLHTRAAEHYNALLEQK